jgi:hypothetical protein
VAIQPSLAGDPQSASALFASTNNNSIAMLGFVLHYRDPANYYALYRMTGGTSVLRISAISNGKETILGQTGVANPVENAFFRLSVAAHDGTLSVTLDGVKTLTVADARFAPGALGALLGTRTTNAALVLSQRADDFNASATITDALATPRLDVALAVDPSPTAVPPGTADVTFANVVLDASASPEDVAVSSVQLSLETDIGATSPQQCQLFDGATPLTSGANVVDPAGAGVYGFTLDQPLAVTVQAPKKLQVICDVPAGAAAGDTMEWRLSPADAIAAAGAQSGKAAAIAIQDSPDDQNRVTVETSGGGGTEVIDLASLRAVLRASEISLGPDLGQQKPPLLPHTAINFQGQSPPNTAWLAIFDGATYGDATVCADMIDSEINGEQCGGVATLVTEGATGRAIVARSCDAKGTDTLRLGVLDVSTGVVTPLANTDLHGRIDTYGGSIPPANCNHNRNQLDYHMYCQWVRTCLTVESGPAGQVSFTATSSLRGTGLKDDPSRNDPYSPYLTLIGTATWTGARPAGVAAFGKIGLVGTATQGWERLSLTNFVVVP